MRLIDRLTRRYGNTFWEGEASGASVLTTSYASADREPVLPQLAGFAQQANSSSAIVFAAILVRMALFSEARPCYQAKDDKHLFGNTSLGKLEEPFGPDTTFGDLAARAQQDVCLAGNSFTWDPPGENRLVRLRPDWTTIISELVQVDGGGEYRRKVGYWWEPPKSLLDQGRGFFIPAAECVHWAPLPDPQADFRGMSWLTPAMREIQGDDGLTSYKLQYLKNSASPNLLIKYQQKLAPGTVDAVRERMHARYGGVSNSFKTLVLDQGADVTVIGNSLTQMDFSGVSAVGVERILADAAVPGVLVGLEPLRGAGRGFQESMKKFSNMWARPEWRSFFGAFAQIMDVPAGNRLWYDTADIAALQDGETERAQAALVRMQALLAARQAGCDLQSAIAAIDSGDLTLIKEGEPLAAAGGNVQHLLPQTSPGASADPLPPTMPRLAVGSTSAGDGGNGTRPTPRPASARRAIEAGPDGMDGADEPLGLDEFELDGPEADWEEDDDLDLDDLLTDAETPPDWETTRFNTFHAKAGSPAGGQFASGGGGGGAAPKASGGAGKASGAAAKAPAGHASGHGATATHPREKAALHEKAAADRAEAHKLETELHALLTQMRASVAAHKHAAASAKASAAAAKHAKTAAAKAKAAAHHKAAVHHRHTAVHHHRHARSLHSRISALRTRISGLLAQAKSLDAQAAKL